MNQKQKIVCGAAVALFVLAGIFPPWVVKTSTLARVVVFKGWLLSPPYGGKYDSRPCMSILAIEWILVSVTACVIALLLKTPKGDA